MTKPVGWSDVATEVIDSSPLLLSFGGAFFNNSLYTSNSGRITVGVGRTSIASGEFKNTGRRGAFSLVIYFSFFVHKNMR